MKFFNLTYLFLLVTITCVQNALCMGDILDFDEIRKKGGFSSDLKKTMRIIPSDTSLKEEELQSLIDSSELTNLRTLSLRGQKLVNDKTIEELCKNKSLSRIINLDLSDTSITEKSIQSILDSAFLGSIRDLPQISSKFGYPSTTIYVTTEDLDLSKEFIMQYNTGEKRKENFFINYRHPQSGEQTYPPKLGIKLLEVKDY